MEETENINDELECSRCGIKDTGLTILHAHGAPWNFIIYCKCCGLATHAKSELKARQKFMEGDCEIEIDPLEIET